MSGTHHLSLGLSRELWQEMLAAALPVRLAGGEFEISQNARRIVKQLGVKERVAGLLEDRQAPQPLVRVKDKAKALWKTRRGDVFKRMNELMRVEGTWRVELDEFGTQLLRQTTSWCRCLFKGCCRGYDLLTEGKR